MLSVEKLVSASAKNRVEASQLHTELGRIEKEKKNELRMLNNEKQRFKARYSKTSFTSSDLPGHEVSSDVKMYETHNPGFCFRRNGEHRVLQPPQATPPVDFERLHFLLFTDGEVDIEKLLCLHLLSTHETEHLTPPRRPKPSINVYLKKESPLEQLIERSNERNLEVTSSMILPTYVLDVNQQRKNRSLASDGRLISRLLINEKILELISTVITTLQDSNPDKVEHLMGIAQDPSNLKRIFRKTHIQQFVMTLKDHALISNCSSFVLSQPYHTRLNHLEIRTPAGILEDLVVFIRSNVLQFPNHDSWRKMQRDTERIDDLTRNLTTEKILRRGNESPKVIQRSDEKRELKIADIEEDSARFRRSSVNFVKRNISAAGSYRKSEDLSEQRKMRKSSIEKRIDSTKKRSVDIKQYETVNSKRKSSDSSDDEVKVHLKQTTCPACMEKWKVPLPTPKVTKMAGKLEQSQLDEENLKSLKLKTDSIQRISTLIEQEQYKLNSYDRKYSNSSHSSNVQLSRNKSMSQRSSLDLIKLDVYDLEKIKQEIREKEVQKKLEKFLED